MRSLFNLLEEFYVYLQGTHPVLSYRRIDKGHFNGEHFPVTFGQGTFRSREQTFTLCFYIKLNSFF